MVAMVATVAMGAVVALVAAALLTCRFHTVL